MGAGEKFYSFHFNSNNTNTTTAKKPEAWSNRAWETAWEQASNGLSPKGSWQPGTALSCIRHTAQGKCPWECRRYPA